MALEPNVKEATRRSILAASGGAALAWIAGAIGRPFTVRATNGDPLTAGNTVTATTTTGATTNSGNGLQGTSSDGIASGVYGENTTGIGVAGLSISGPGVTAQSVSNSAFIGTTSSGTGLYVSSGTGTAVNGDSGAADKPATRARAYGDSTGVLGYSGPLGSEPANRVSVGVHGYAAQSQTARGVVGESIDGYGAEGLSTSSLGVHGKSTSGIGVYGESSSAIGVAGVSQTGVGVQGGSNGQIGVRGTSNAATFPGTTGQSNAGSTGVLGYSSAGGPLPAAPAKTGVYGYAVQDANARGVTGESTAGRGVNGLATTGIGVLGVASTGRAVAGLATGAGIAGWFSAASGTALQVTGKATFSRSGKLAVPAGASSITKVLAGVTTGSLVLALLQANKPGVYVRAAVAAAGSFTIYFNVALPSSASVAYFVLN